MRTGFALVALVILGASTASAQLALKVDPRGTILEVRVGDAVYLEDVGVALVKPGWNGNLADQRDVDPATVRVHRDGATTTYAMPLRGQAFVGRLIERIVRDGDAGVSMEFEVIPEQDVEVETVLLRGRSRSHRTPASRRTSSPPRARRAGCCRGS
jgi:hypothetical protein